MTKINILGCALLVVLPIALGTSARRSADGVPSDPDDEPSTPSPPTEPRYVPGCVMISTWDATTGKPHETEKMYLPLSPTSRSNKTKPRPIRIPAATASPNVDPTPRDRVFELLINRLLKDVQQLRDENNRINERLSAVENRTNDTSDRSTEFQIGYVDDKLSKLVKDAVDEKVGIAVSENINNVYARIGKMENGQGTLHDRIGKMEKVQNTLRAQIDYTDTQVSSNKANHEELAEEYDGRIGEMSNAFLGFKATQDAHMQRVKKDAMDSANNMWTGVLYPMVTENSKKIETAMASAHTSWKHIEAVQKVVGDGQTYRAKMTSEITAMKEKVDKHTIEIGTVKKIVETMESEGIGSVDGEDHRKPALSLRDTVSKHDDEMKELSETIRMLERKLKEDSEIMATPLRRRPLSWSG